MSKYFHVPKGCISSELPICPLCGDTKTVEAPVQSIKLSVDREYRVECSSCNIWWSMYKIVITKGLK